jgi:hypothetical protein
MVNASRTLYERLRIYDEQILAQANHRAEAGQSPAERTDMVSVTVIRTESDSGENRAAKKKPPFPAAKKLITGRRQTEWTGATRCPKLDSLSNG